MPGEVVPADRARPIRRKVGITVSIRNPSAVIVSYDSDPGVLNRTVQGVAQHDGTPIAAGATGTIASNPGTFYLRAGGAAAVVVDIQP